ncbi:MAG: MafI family immunity protein [Prochloraceae cyanobacterium]
MNHNNIEAEIKKLGNLFIGRLDRNILEDAIEYVDFNECSLAIETLCDQLYEYDVNLNCYEFNQIKELAEKVAADIKKVEYLKSLIK